MAVQRSPPIEAERQINDHIADTRTAMTAITTKRLPDGDIPSGSVNDFRLLVSSPQPIATAESR